MAKNQSSLNQAPPATQPTWPPSSATWSSPGPLRDPSPDLSPLDYWFWSVCLAELRRSPPSSLDELKDIVENYVDSLQEQEVIKATRNMMKRAKACREAVRGPFEFKLKKTKNNRAVEE